MYNFGHSLSVHLSKAYKGFFANKLCPALRPIEKNDDITQLKFRFSKKEKKMTKSPSCTVNWKLLYCEFIKFQTITLWFEPDDIPFCFSFLINIFK